MEKAKTSKEPEFKVNIIPLGTQEAAEAAEGECYKIIANSKKWKKEVVKTQEEVTVVGRSK